MSVFQRESRASVFNHILWVVLGLIAVLILESVAYEYRHGSRINHTGLVIGIVLASISFIGIMRRWGPLIPCMFYGTIVFGGLASGPSSSHQIFQELVVPLIGAIFGAIAGFALNSKMSRSVTPNQEKSDMDAIR